MLITQYQINLLIRESLSTPDNMLLTEAELHEIAPFIAAMGRSLGNTLMKGLAGIAKKGVAGVAEWAAKNPESVGEIKAMLMQASDKMPGIQKALEGLGKNPDDVNIVQMLENPPENIKAELDNVFKNAGTALEKAEECECPDPAQETSLMSKFSSFFS